MNDAAPAPAVPPVCPRCHAAIPAGAPPGVCPQCELQGALELWSAPVAGASSGEAAGAIEELAASPRQFGDYEILEEIARGGMGVVYRARQRSLDRIVALKMLLSGPLASREFIQRFRTEAAATASLQHPNIVAIHEVGFHAGQHFFAMDFVAGRTLAEIISGQPMPPPRAAGYLKTVAEAVHYAHEHGILHRDLKPSNVIIDAEDQPRITDFGLAKRVSGDTEATLSAQTLGSPSYMPPEQAATDRGKVSRRSDVYALGALLYHALTGRPPFVGGTLAETLRALLDTEPVSPRQLNPSVPADLETICLKCLEKDSARRYGTAQQLAGELGCFLKGEPILARPVSRAERVWRWCRRKPALAALGATVLLLLNVIAVGSTVAALRLKQKEQDLRTALRGAYLSEAHLRRESGKVGQRFHSLSDLGRAAAIQSSLELRNEAIAALALPDLRELERFECAPGASLSFDAALTTFAEWQAAGTEPGAVVIRRLADRRELARMVSGGVMLSPDGRFLVQLGAGTEGKAELALLDVETKTTVFRGAVPARGMAVAFHPLKPVAAIGQTNGQVLIFDLLARRSTATAAAGLAANRLAFHPDGARLAVAKVGQAEVLVLDLERDTPPIRLVPEGIVVSTLDWSSDGRRLAVGCRHPDAGDLVQLWEWGGTNARPTRMLRGHQSPVVLVRFIPQTDLLWTASYEPSTRLWSASTGKQLLATPHWLAMYAVAGRRVAWQVAPTTYAIHELVVGDEYRLLPGPVISPTHPSLSFSPRAPLIASASVDGVRLWHLPSGLAVGVLPVGPSGCALFHPRDGSLLVAADERVTRWPVELSPRGEIVSVGPPLVISGPRARGHDFRFSLSADGSHLACVADTEAEVVDLRQKTAPLQLAHGTPLNHVGLSPDAAWAVTSGGERFRVWKLPEGRLLHDLPGGGYAFTAFSSDSRWVVMSSATPGSSDGVHRLHRVGTWEQVCEFPMQSIVWAAAAFSPDGRLLAVRASGSGVRLLDTRDWSELATFDVPEQQMIFELAFSADGTQLGVACESRLVQVWDLRAVRLSLARLGLDWDHPPYPPAAPEADVVARLVIKP